jgi:segregation and condensation protein B
VIAALRGAHLIATGPRSRSRAPPHTYVTTPAFLTLGGLASLRELPDLDRLEEAGLLGKAPLPEELRGALGITGDDEDEDGAEIDAEEDGEYAGVGLVEE